MLGLPRRFSGPRRSSDGGLRRLARWQPGDWRLESRGWGLEDWVLEDSRPKSLTQGPSREQQHPRVEVISA